MPLSKVKQAEYQKERRLRLKSVIPSVIPKPDISVIPKSTASVIPKVLNIPGLKMVGNKVVGVDKPQNVIPTSYPSSELPYIPWYNPAKHVVGQKVRMKDAQGKVQTVITPEVDGDGRPMWESW